MDRTRRAVCNNVAGMPHTDRQIVRYDDSKDLDRCHSDHGFYRSTSYCIYNSIAKELEKVKFSLTYPELLNRF